MCFHVAWHCLCSVWASPTRHKIAVTRDLISYLLFCLWIILSVHERLMSVHWLTSIPWISTNSWTLIGIVLVRRVAYDPVWRNLRPVKVRLSFREAKGHHANLAYNTCFLPGNDVTKATAGRVNGFSICWTVILMASLPRSVSGLVNLLTLSPGYSTGIQYSVSCESTLFLCLWGT